MYYAKFTETSCEVLAFKTKAERNNWVEFKDEFSVAAGSTPCNATFQRESITSRDAAETIGRKNLYDENHKEEHELLQGVFVILAF